MSISEVISAASSKTRRRVDLETVRASPCGMVLPSRDHRSRPICCIRSIVVGSVAKNEDRSGSGGKDGAPPSCIVVSLGLIEKGGADSVSWSGRRQLLRNALRSVSLTSPLLPEEFVALAGDDPGFEMPLSPRLGSILRSQEYVSCIRNSRQTKKSVILSDFNKTMTNICRKLSYTGC